MFFKQVCNNSLCKQNFAYRNTVFAYCFRIDMLTCINVNRIINTCDYTGDCLCTNLYKIVFSDCQRLIVHPQKWRCKTLIRCKVCTLYKHTPSWNVNFFVKSNCDRLTFKCSFWLLVTYINFFYMSTFIARQCCNLVTDIYAARFNLTLKTSECVVRSADSLYREIKSLFRIFFAYIYIFKIFQKRFAVIPSDVFRFNRYVVTLCCRQRNYLNVFKWQFVFQFFNLSYDFIISIFIILYKVHLIYGKHKVTYTHKLTNSRMTSCLNKHALWRIDKNYSQVRKWRTYRHVSCIFFVSGCIGNDKTSVVGCEIAVCNVNRYTLFSFSHKSVK